MKKYYIYSYEHRAFWKPNSCGYTYEISSAGVYSETEANSIVKSANVNEIINEVLIPYTTNEIVVPSRYSTTENIMKNETNQPSVEESGLSMNDILNSGFKIVTKTKRNIVLGSAKAIKFSKLSKKNQKKFYFSKVRLVTDNELDKLRQENTPYFVLSRGGEIEVEVVSPKGKVSIGKSWCNWVDNFNYKTGREYAIARAFGIQDL
jgi:hypothetical protein